MPEVSCARIASDQCPRCITIGRETSGVLRFQRRTANGYFVRCGGSVQFMDGSACEPPVLLNAPCHSHYLHGLEYEDIPTVSPKQLQSLFDVRRSQVMKTIIASSAACSRHSAACRLGRAFVVAIDKNEIPLCSRQSCDFSNSSGAAVAYSLRSRIPARPTNHGRIEMFGISQDWINNIQCHSGQGKMTSRPACPATNFESRLARNCRARL